jgi:hypothetical protein
VVLFNRRSDDKTFFGELYQLIEKAIKDVRQWPEDDLLQMPDSSLAPRQMPADTAFQARLLNIKPAWR